MKKKNKSKVLVVVLILAAVILFIIAYLKITNKEKPSQVIEEVKTVDNIQTKEFDYVLYDNKSSLYKEYLLLLIKR